MKLKELKAKLLSRSSNQNLKIKKEYLRKKDKKECKDLNKLRIIGITGSRGKSSVAYMVHEYLKQQGYKTILYSSAMVDSKASLVNKNEACEVSLNSEAGLLAILEEAEHYDAEYLVLEINESTIEKGLTKDIPFDIRVLTNLNSKHNLEQYTEEQYVDLKKSFFKDIDNECKCVIGFQDYEKELLTEILLLNSCDKVLFSSQYIAGVKGVDPNTLTCVLESLDSSLEGLRLKIKVKDRLITLNTKMMMSYNAMNILCAVSVLETLGILDEAKLNEWIDEIKIPGRAEVYKANGRMIVIDPHLPKMLEELKKFKVKKLINKIKVVVGSVGYGFRNWEEKFKTESFITKRKEFRKYAMNLLKEDVDYVYLTEQDNGKEAVLDICKELQNYLGNDVESKIIENRSQAIKQAIRESEKGDVIFISGRGNRRVLCNSETTMKLLKDSDVVKETLKELGWQYNG